MKWSIRQIEDNSGLPLKFSQVIDIKSSLMERESEILDVSPVKLNGTLLYDKHSVIAMFTIEAIVTLPSSRSLVPVPVNMVVDVNERYVEQGYVSQYSDTIKDEIIIPLDANIVDLSESIIDNILLNLPIQVLSSQEQHDTTMPSGDGWVVMSEEAYQQLKQKEAEESVDPRLAGLQNLLIDNEQGE